MWFRIAESAEIIPDVIKRQREMFHMNPQQVLPRLASTLLKFRDQEAANPLDKVYAFLGMAQNEYSIEPDYAKSTREVFTDLTRKLLQNILLVLLWVETSSREMDPGKMEYPSWVPDFSQKQTMVSKCMGSTYNCFNTGGVTVVPPLVPPYLKWRFENASNNGVEEEEETGKKNVKMKPEVAKEFLVLKGVYVGIVTKVKSSRLTTHESGKPFDNVMLI